MKDRRGLHPVNQQNWFAPGNQAARKHGAYARYHPPEIVERITPDAPSPKRLESLIQLEEARLHALLQEKAAWAAKAEYGALAHGDYPLTEVRNDHLGTATKRERPDFEGLIDRSMGRISALVAEKERIKATPAYVANTLARILDEAEAAGLSAVDTAERVERAGLAVPFSLQQRVRAELSTYEPPEPEGGMTDDELERLSLEYEEEIEGEVEWLEQRREEVRDMHSKQQSEKHSE
ncbi:hypothetical protein [Halomonas sp. 707B3]|jgi:hypothetical protein|uniref:hypothetical protein n=1 Tax=Halomonas sp. 707B3 TaxID=1681043 RepID=UPI000C659BC5|nr:hypothetical protein [Halomonas sp. 707B3]MAG54596.1 hypothetical protein [Halomonas sp.]MCP1318535.1 hypothetical protein [Halomonas sp. 707B3]|tara:strand:- start:198 stop:905 length:708 start_codon:yes stop_codon:yes gene_type:complete